jgi:hypothetical protein
VARFAYFRTQDIIPAGWYPSTSVGQQPQIPVFDAEGWNPSNFPGQMSPTDVADAAPYVHIRPNQVQTVNLMDELEAPIIVGSGYAFRPQ